MIEGIDYFVRLVPFPTGSGSDGMVLLNDDCTYSVYLNSKATVESRRKAMRHELKHMTSDDMYGEKSVAELENLA